MKIHLKIQKEIAMKPLNKNEDDLESTVRLNRYLAMCGLFSRRKADDAIRSEDVKVNGVVVTDPGTRLSGNETVTVRDVVVKPCRNVYLVINKPEGFVCSVKDAHNRTVMEILPSKYGGMNIFPVGRLDKNSRGLLILTNDGKLANRISHPSYGVSKQYIVRLDGQISQEQLEIWKQGLLIEEKKIVPEHLDIIDRKPYNRWIRITLTEGIKREIRIMAKMMGFGVNYLQRVRIGRMELKFLKPGEVRSLKCEELVKLIEDGGYL